MLINNPFLQASGGLAEQPRNGYHVR